MTQRLEVRWISERGGDQIQERIDICIDWEKDWQMEFNLSECKVLGMGKNNENRDYRMQGVILEHVKQEKDLGVVIDMGGKQAAQCQEAIGKASRVFGCILMGIIYKSRGGVNIVQEFSEGHISNIACRFGYYNSGWTSLPKRGFSARLLD